MLPLGAGSESYLRPGVEGPASKYRGRIGLGGAAWWRYGGEVSRAMLEHSETRLLPEMPWQTEARKSEGQTAALKGTLNVFRRHLKERRQFVLDQDEVRELP